MSRDSKIFKTENCKRNHHDGLTDALLAEHTRHEVSELSSGTQCKYQESIQKGEKHLVQCGILPDVKIRLHKDKADQLCSDLLANVKTNPEKALREIDKLVAAGTTKLTVTTVDGKSIDVRLEVEKVGHRKMVHMFARDENGHEKTVLRGISKGAHYERERNCDGNFVSYLGPGAHLISQAKSVTSEHNSERAMKQGPVSTETGSNGRVDCYSGSSDVALKNANHVLTDYGPNKFVTDARGTAYYPCNNELEGGFKDKRGKGLCTLQAFLKGDANYVSVAMDGTVPYGTKLRIPELEAKYGRNIEFRVVDTGGAFTGKGHSRIDICVENQSAANDSIINGQLTLHFV